MAPSIDRDSFLDRSVESEDSNCYLSKERVMDSTTVLIVGAGPTGLTLACELARTGVPFRVVEAAPGPQQGSRGKGVQPRTLEVLDDLGIVDRVLANGRLAMPMRIFGPDGSVAETDAVTFRDRPDIPYGATLVTPEWRMEEALRELLAASGGPGPEFGTRLLEYTQDDDAVTAVLERDGITETVTATWLVGCDGGHSVVRKGAGITFDGETLDEVRMLIADVPVEGLDRDAWAMWRHPEGMVSLCPLPSTDLFQFQGSVAPGQDPDTALANLQTMLDTRTGRTDIRFGSPAWVSLWRANIRLVDRYRVGRAFIAGDAAHIHSPAGGQGMNTGIQDAHNLGWKLAAVEHGADAALLDTYEAERRPVAEGVLALSNERLRHAIANGVMQTKGDANTMQLTVGYRGSALAIDDRSDDAEIRAGERVADAPALRTADGEVRLFDLLRGPAWTLFRFGSAPLPDVPTSVRVVHVVDDAREPGDVVDTEGYLAAALGAADGALVLVRPDGYVGGVSDAGDPAALAPLVALAR
jgi:2-polyprenyl-6-methoxyphenol hydroxylase-like FAD-dependent oxidoreductase